MDVLGRYGDVVPSQVNPNCPCVHTSPAHLEELRRATGRNVFIGASVGGLCELVVGPHPTREPRLGSHPVLQRYGLVAASQVNPDLPCSVTSHDKLEERLEEVRAALAPGEVAFIGAYSELPRIGAGRVYWYREIVVGPGEDQWAIPRLAGTREVTDALRDLDRRFGLDIRSAERGAVGFRLDRLPDDVPALVDELYELSPDPVDIGWMQSKESWAESISETRAVYLWWQGY